MKQLFLEVQSQGHDAATSTNEEKVKLQTYHSEQQEVGTVVSGGLQANAVKRRSSLKKKEQV